MAFKLGKISARKLLNCALGIGAALLLASCGGGGGSSGTNPTQPVTPTLSLSLVSPTTASTPLAAYASTTLTVKVLSNNVVDTSPVSVTFASPCATAGKAILPASATTTNGEATVTYTDAGCSASDLITISTTGATSITETLVVAAPTAASVEFVSAVPATESIVIAGAGGNGRVETAALTFEVLDTQGKPLPNQTVNFSLVPAGVVNLQTTSGLTDASGKVVATVSSKSSPTTFRVVATLPSGQSTMSDTVAVTTGQTAPDSLSISVTNYNIEGWNFDNTTSTVNVLLADSFGNPVADGTPIVANTNSGAIGTSALGGCVTTNGACSLTFRSQNPRYGAGALPVPSNARAGMASISISTSTANQPNAITGQTGIFLSGSYLNTAIPSVDTTNTTNKVIAPTSTIPWYTVKLTSCNPASIAVQLNDVNNNPMPVKTTLAISAVSKGYNLSNVPNPVVAVGAISPASVPNVPPDTFDVTAMATYQGSFHSFVVTPATSVAVTTPATSACVSGGIYPTTDGTLTGPMSPNGEVDIQATTQTGGVVSVAKVLLWYPQSPQ